MTPINAEKLLARCVALADEKKGGDMVSLRLSELTTMCDYFLLITAGNSRQAQSICDNIYEGLKEDGLSAPRLEGYDGAQWILMDAGPVIVHIFLAETRDHYDLERLWGDAERIEY